MPATANADGTVEYKAPLSVTDVTLDGVSILALTPIEIKVWPDGWGYVCTVIDPETGLGKTWVDNQTRNFTRWGRIEVTLPEG